MRKETLLLIVAAVLLGVIVPLGAVLYTQHRQHEAEAARVKSQREEDEHSAKVMADLKAASDRFNADAEKNLADIQEDRDLLKKGETLEQQHERHARRDLARLAATRPATSSSP